MDAKSHTVCKVLDAGTRVVLARKDLVLMTFGRIIGQTVRMGIVASVDNLNETCRSDS